MLIYTTVMLKPLMPIASDCYAHAFNGMSHIATVHAQFGSNHLQKEMEDMTKGDSGKAGNVTKNITEVPVQVVIDEVVDINFPNNASLDYFSFFLHFFPVSYLALLGPPPKFSC